MFYSYSVGKPYHPDKTIWPEHVEYDYRGGEHELIMFWPDPTIKEIEEVKNGPAEFGLFVEDNVIFFLYKFGTMQWSDAPFSIHLIPEHERVIPGPKHGLHAILNIVLVDANNGLIEVLRASTLSPEFTTALEKAIQEQSSKPFDATEHQKSIDRAYKMYSHSRDMAQRAIIKTKGGD